MRGGGGGSVSGEGGRGRWSVRGDGGMGSAGE